VNDPVSYEFRIVFVLMIAGKQNPAPSSAHEKESHMADVTAQA
jgi:hypothetical protein